MRIVGLAFSTAKPTAHNFPPKDIYSSIHTHSQTKDENVVDSPLLEPITEGMEGGKAVPTFTGSYSICVRLWQSSVYGYGRYIRI